MQSNQKIILRGSILNNTISAVIIFFYDLCFINLNKTQFIQAIITGFIIITLAETILSPTVNKLITFSITSKILHWQAGSSTKKERTELFRAIMKFPFIKAFEIYCIFAVGSATLSLCLLFFTHLEIHESITFILIGFATSYFSFILTFYNSQILCSKIAKDVVAQGISQKRIIQKHLFGISLTNMYLIYIVLPVICCFILNFLLCSSQPNSIYRILFVSIINCLVLTILIILFCKKIHSQAEDMKSSLLLINAQNITATQVISTDLSSELAYTQYLINHALDLFHTMLAKNSNISCEINTSALELSSVAQETQATAQNQSDSISQVVKSMESTTELSNTIAVKSDEVVNVADKTAKDIEQNVKQINSNLSIMKEIITFNRATIIGIQNLYTKISNVQDIINLIDNVADQTKIIAFNAEMEAGSIQNDDDSFQNVSMEIRHLADNTMSMTKQIKEQIEEILHASDSLIITGRTCMQKIEEGDTLSMHLETRFRNIQATAQHTLENAKIIKQHIQEQTAAFNQIGKVLEQINNGITSINEGTIDISDSVLKMQQDSENLQKISAIATETKNEGEEQ